MSEPPDETQSIEPGALGTQGTAQAAPQDAPPAAPAPRDRLAVHLVWEGVLFLIVVALVREALVSTHGVHFTNVVAATGYTGLVAAGLALSLRTGTPNLAVGSIATATGILGAHLATTDGWSLWAGMTLAVVIAAVVGLVTGLIVAALSVPAWAATLAVAMLVQAAALGITHGQIVALHGGGSYSTTPWLVTFVVVSVGGGALWLVPRVRATLSATRSAREPGPWAGLRAGLGAVVGLTGSSLLAGVGGVALAIYLLSGDPQAGGVDLTVVALAAVLFGGVSVFGRRAGVFGTVLGVVIVTTIQFIMNLHAVPVYWLDVPIGILAVLGLGVSRAMESITDAMNQPPMPGLEPPRPGLPPSQTAIG